MKSLSLIVALFVAMAFPYFAAAQNSAREMYITWDDFVTDYLAADAGDAAADREALLLALDELEQLYTMPLNVNAATSVELQQMPFLSAAQADSIVSYRQKKRAFLSLGELQFVRGLTPTLRQWLSLFLVVGDTLQTEKPQARQRAETDNRRHSTVYVHRAETNYRDTIFTFADRLYKGRHEVVTRLDVPLYKRSGYTTHSEEELLQYPNRIYLGNNLANTVRYRYKCGRLAAYGITLQKDAGEPFGSYNNYPYDYVSGYAFLSLFGERLAVWAGHFDARSALGLLLGNSAFSSKSQMLTGWSTTRDDFRPHTSTDESAYYQGLALRWRQGRWDAETFFSYRRLDGTLKGDTITSLATDGLHRTQGELAKRRQLGNLTIGLRTAYRRYNWHIGFTALLDRYDRTIFPPLRVYNQYYLRGTSASGFSVDYAQRHGRWHSVGELAFDERFHLAATHTLRYEPLPATALTLQTRHFSPRFVSPHGVTLQEGSRVQNETGVLLGLTTIPHAKWEVQAYADWFRFSRPTYTASLPHSQGIEGSVQAKWFAARRLSFLVRYRVKARQQNVTGVDSLLQYVTTHRFRISTTFTRSARFSLTASADATLVTRQTSSSSFGWMLSARTAWRPTDRLSLNVFVATFFTPDYASRLYAYEPQLLYAGGFPSYAYHGMKCVAQCVWQPFRSLTLSCRYSMLHYFNRDHIGSGTQRLDSSTQNDLSLQVAWRY